MVWGVPEIMGVFDAAVRGEEGDERTLIGHDG